MPMFRKKPVVIEALHFTGINVEEAATSNSYVVRLCPTCGKALPSPYVIHSVGFACVCAAATEAI